MSAIVINQLKRTIAEAAATQEAALAKLAALEEADAERKKKHADAEAEWKQAVARITEAVKIASSAVREPQDLPVFSFAHHDIKMGRLKKEDLSDFVACCYGLDKDLGTLFATKTKEQFKQSIKGVRTAHGPSKLSQAGPHKIYTFMKAGADNIGKKIIVAFDKRCGSVGEIREITGPYHYSPIAARTSDRPSGFYFHQFPPKLIRKLTAEESEEVAQARKKGDLHAINWTARLTV